MKANTFTLQPNIIIYINVLGWKNKINIIKILLFWVIWILFGGFQNIIILIKI